jgi:Family of unknown function (DUF6464)
MILDAFAISIVIFLGLSPILIMIWGVHYLAQHPHLYLYRHRAHGIPRQDFSRQDIQDINTAALARRTYPQSALSPYRGQLGWFGSVGYLGDTSCQFNAHSPFIRCAVNPSGPCQNCTYYETSAHLADSHQA